MTSDDKPRRVEVRDGDQTVAAAEVAEHAEGTIRTSLLPFGDAGSLERLRERTEDTVTRPAGSTVLVDADIPGTDDADPGGEASDA